MPKIKRRISRRKITYGLVFFAICWTAASLFYYYTEGFSLLDSFYFSSTVVTTLGLSSFFVQTPAGKIFTMFYSLFGLALIFLLTHFIHYYLGGILLEWEKIDVEKPGTAESRKIPAARVGRRK